MSADVALSASKRDVVGKQVRALRRQGQIPAVVHDHGKDSLHITLEASDFKKVFASAGKHHPVALKIDGKAYTTLIKEVTHSPGTNLVLHTVLQSVEADEKVSAEIPLNLSEDNPATRANLLVLRQLDHVEVEALPKDLIDVIEVDTSSLVEVGDKITVADLKVPSTVVIKTDSEQTIATVETPKDQIAEADASAAETATQTGADTAEEAGETSEEEAKDASEEE